MAMSKKCFALILLGSFILLGGGIALIVLFKNNNSVEEDSSKSKPIKDSLTESDAKLSKNNLDFNKNSDSECRKYVRSQRKQIEFPAQFTKSRMATRETVFAQTREKIVRNAYWLTGDKFNDAETLNDIRFQACIGKIPVVVIRMRPNTGLELSHMHSNWDYYKPKSPISSWADYDSELKKYINALTGFPAIIILEPDLLMFAYDSKNSQHRWNNKQYETEFLIRAQRIVKKLPQARVYLDAGNAQYLGKSKANLDQMATTLLRITGLRGFSINTFHFINQTLNEFFARQLYCRTGLHYLIDTSRNGGSFSKQPLPEVEKCLFDPPDIKKGQFPGWAWGSQKPINAPRLKRWINQIGSSSNQYSENSVRLVQQRIAPTTRATTRSSSRTDFQLNNRVDRNDPNWEVNQYNNMINNRKNNNHDNNDNNNNNNNNNNNYNDHYQNSNNLYNENNRRNNQQRYSSSNSENKDKASKGSSKNDVRSVEVATEYLRSFKATMRSCMSRRSNLIAHDANVWMKAAGESDGRLFRFGLFRPCLINHAIPCDDSCQMFVQRDSNRRNPDCQCSVKKVDENPRTPSRNSFPLDNFPFV